MCPTFCPYLATALDLVCNSTQIRPNSQKCTYVCNTNIYGALFGWPAKHKRNRWLASQAQMFSVAGQPSTLNTDQIFAVSCDCLRISAKVDTNMRDRVILTKVSRSTHCRQQVEQGESGDATHPVTLIPQNHRMCPTFCPYLVTALDLVCNST